MFKGLMIICNPFLLPFAFAGHSPYYLLISILSAVWGLVFMHMFVTKRHDDQMATMRRSNAALRARLASV